MVQDDEIYHYHLDHLGTPRELTNQQGDIVWKARYKTYGNLALKEIEEVENNLRFQGQYFDEETGLHYNRHRYYDPSVGQFTTQDPIGLLGGVNSYQYVPNPTGWIDPLGLTSKECDSQKSGPKATNSNISQLSFGELRALKTAGFSRTEIEQQLQLNGDIYLFRGTSPEWAGSPGAQATAVSASLDPFVATVFALEARGQAGQAVLQFGSRSEIGIFTRGNWFAVQEREVGVLTNSVGFAERAPNSIPVDQARAILKDMGMLSLPRAVANSSDRSILLNATPKMTPEQVAEFLRRAKN